MSGVTEILSKIESGDQRATEDLLPLVYDELRKLAMARLAHQAPGQTLQATALVHEAYLRLVNVEEAQHWASRGHFFVAAAEAIRRILVERTRRKARVKHGGGRARVELDEACIVSNEPNEDLLFLDEALERFSQVAPKKADLVKLRYFAGMTITEAAETLGISHATAERYWHYARVWLYTELNDADDVTPGECFPQS